MKNKIGFVMPRLVGATVFAGVATLIAVTVFKLLLAITVLAGVISLVARLARKQENRLLKYGRDHGAAFGNWGGFGNRGPATNSIRPFGGFANPKEATIVPID